MSSRRSLTRVSAMAVAATMIAWALTGCSGSKGENNALTSATPSPTPSPTGYVLVPYVEGMTLTKARSALSAMGFGVAVRARRPSEESKNSVLSQSPAAGTALAPQQLVRVVLSNGQVRLPRLVGRPLGKAKRVLKNMGMKISVLHRYSLGTNHVVLQQFPGPGMMSNKKKAIRLVIAEYPRVGAPCEPSWGPMPPPFYCG